MICANFQLYGKVQIDDGDHNDSPEIVMQDAIDILNENLCEEGLDQYGKLVPISARLTYTGYVCSNRCFRHAFYFNDKQAMNKFKLKYPTDGDRFRAFRNAGLNYDTDRLCMQYAMDIALVAIVDGSSEFDTVKDYQYNLITKKMSRS